MLSIGVLNLQGAVSEHVAATKRAVDNIGAAASVRAVEYPREIHNLTHLIIGGGESTTISKLMQRVGMDAAIKKAAAGRLRIFGTCAGAVLLAKHVDGLADGQETLALIDISIKRNAFGRQADSFEQPLRTSLGSINAVFIRAPAMERAGRGVRVIAKLGRKVVAVQQGRFLATAFHPELSGSTLFHEHFLGL
jgi:5'-phosphate synthase pdxT subunit